MRTAQATWIGYPNSTGLAAVDYRLTDAVCDPPETRQAFVEELVRLPGCFLCYTPPADAPAVAPLPASELGVVTFGSFNALAKLTLEVLRLWGRVLQAVPSSRLLLKSKPFACQHARRHFLTKASLPRQPTSCLAPVQRLEVYTWVRKVQSTVKEYAVALIKIASRSQSGDWADKHPHLNLWCLVWPPSCTIQLQHR